MSVESDVKGAAVKFPPPLIFVFMMLAGWGVQKLYPADIGVSASVGYFGLGIAVLAIVMVMSISQSFKRSETNIEPWKPTTTIITTGIYAYSRNPIYAFFCFVPLGLGIFLNSYWILFSFVPSAFLVYFIAIKKEEEYLSQKFGAEYLNYKASVRRWL